MLRIIIQPYYLTVRDKNALLTCMKCCFILNLFFVSA